MAPAESQGRTGLLLVTLIMTIVLLADLVGFMQWYKNIRSYILLPVTVFIDTIQKNSAYTLISIVKSDTLKKQNIELRQRVIELESLAESYKTELDKVPRLNELSSIIGRNNYKSVEQAQILDVQHGRIKGMLQINKGTQNGITVGMPAVFGNFYIGYVSSVTSNDSIITGYMVPGQEFAGYVQTKKITGIVTVGVNDIELGDLLATEQVALHDIVSIRQENFPYFFTLGLISKVPLNNGSAERKATITGKVSVNDLTYITIIKQ
ncbi:hypothetical protein IT418_01765 [bacterium]|nr:hypothetical protein [bacterium]